MDHLPSEPLYSVGLKQFSVLELVHSIFIWEWRIILSGYSTSFKLTDKSFLNICGFGWNSCLVNFILLCSPFLYSSPSILQSEFQHNYVINIEWQLRLHQPIHVSPGGQTVTDLFIAWVVCFPISNHVIFSRELFFYASKNYSFTYTPLFENLKAQIIQSIITRAVNKGRNLYHLLGLTLDVMG